MKLAKHVKQQKFTCWFNYYFIQALKQILVPATSSLLPSLLLESPLCGVEKIGGAPHPPLLGIAFTSLICTTVYITATIAIVAIFTEGIALCPCHVINIGCWGVTGPERVLSQEVVHRNAHLRRSGADVVWWERKSDGLTTNFPQLPSITPPRLKPPGTNSLAVAFNDIPE